MRRRKRRVEGRAGGKKAPVFGFRFSVSGEALKNREAGKTDP
jgi:hypothetical protein